MRVVEPVKTDLKPRIIRVDSVTMETVRQTCASGAAVKIGFRGVTTQHIETGELALQTTTNHHPATCIISAWHYQTQSTSYREHQLIKSPSWSCIEVTHRFIRNMIPVLAFKISDLYKQCASNRELYIEMVYILLVVVTLIWRVKAGQPTLIIMGSELSLTLALTPGQQTALNFFFTKVWQSLTNSIASLYLRYKWAIQYIRRFNKRANSSLTTDNREKVRGTKLHTLPSIVHSNNVVRRLTYDTK